MVADAYAYIRDCVAAVLETWNTGIVTLVRASGGTPDPETPWTPGARSVEVFALDARVDGVTADDLDGTTIVATDLKVIASPRARNADGEPVEIEPNLTDLLTIDGAEKVIKKIEAIPAAGPPAMFHIFVAS
jgi:hypothetical protein